MKTKISPLEELRSKKELLKVGCKIHQDNLANNWDYTKNNLGHLAMNSIFSSTKSGLSDIFSMVTGGKNSRNTGTTANAFLSAAPMAWQLAQPFLIGMLIRRVKSMFSRKKKKKR